jgi:apolipoprotein N-acyltransferase
VLRTPLILSALAGLLTAAALPNELFFDGNLFLGLICLVPYFLALRRFPAVRPIDEARGVWREDALVGAVYGLVYGFTSNYWLMFFGEFSVWTIGGVTLGFTIYHSVLAPILGTHRRLPAWARPLVLALYFAVFTRV